MADPVWHFGLLTRARHSILEETVVTVVEAHDLAGEISGAIVLEGELSMDCALDATEYPIFNTISICGVSDGEITIEGELGDISVDGTAGGEHEL
jgi:hypothetical protein